MGSHRFDRHPTIICERAVQRFVPFRRLEGVGTGRLGRRVAAITLLAVAGMAAWAAPVVRADLNEADRRPRVLMLGDSILDQHGNPAAVLLRAAGIETEVHGAWGTGLLTREQYDFGDTVPNPATHTAFNWLIEGPKLVEQMRPDLVVVYLDHNYWEPFPRDAAGNEIRDLRTPAAQAMIGTQARAFIERLRHDGADVVFVAPVPGSGNHPQNDNAIWAGYLPVLRALHVGIIDIRSALAGEDGRRVETKPDCTGTATRVRPENDLHLTRFGAGRAATALATGVAQRFGRELHGDPAPGDHTATIVPAAANDGYWIIGCDGGVYPVGNATPLPGEHPAPGDPVIGAARAGARGLWLVTRAGRVLRRGDAPALSFSSVPGPLVDAAGTGNGIVAVDGQGRVAVAGGATWAGDAPAGAPPIAIASLPVSAGYWIVTADGGVHGFGTARSYGAAANLPLAPIIGIAATASGNGYWLTRVNGAIEAFGDAASFAPVVKEDASKGGTAAVTPDAASVAIVAGANGVWIVDDNGAVHGRGDAPELGGTGNLALFTQ
jgi:hypothetical protein